MREQKISIISPVRNMIEFLPHMIHSVEKQTYKHWEHIIVDGDSQDGTLKYLLQKKSQNVFIISEPDLGIYDAINKGIMRSTGDYICILNSDDWYEPDFLEKAIAGINSSGADWVFGDNMFHYADGTTHIVPGDPFYEDNSWATFTRFHHTTVLAKKECFDAVGTFPLTVESSLFKSTDLAICADYKWFLRLQKAGFRGSYIQEIMGHMRWGGISTTQIERAHLEGRLVALSEFDNHNEINAAWKRIERRHSLKRIIAILFDSMPKNSKSILRKFLGAQLSGFIYEKIKHFKK